MSDPAILKPEPQTAREEAIRHMAEVAIRTGEKLLAIANAAREVALDPELGASPALERLRAALREAGMLALGLTFVSQFTS